MKIKKIIGAIMVLIPFIIIGTIMVNQDGWEMFIKVFGSVMGIIIFVGIGVHLLFDSNMET